MGLLNTKKTGKLENRLEELIKEGNKFKFQNVANHTRNGSYASPSNELFTWVAEVENFIEENYGVDSVPFRFFLKHDHKKLSGSLENTFTKQIEIIKGALISCRKITPSKRNKPESNEILSLLKNKYFYACLAVLVGGAFTLGHHLGVSKFDSEKNDLYTNTKSLKSTNETLNMEFKSYRDSVQKINTNNSKNQMVTP